MSDGKKGLKQDEFGGWWIEPDAPGGEWEQYDTDLALERIKNPWMFE